VEHQLAAQAPYFRDNYSPMNHLQCAGEPTHDHRYQKSTLIDLAVQIVVIGVQQAHGISSSIRRKGERAGWKDAEKRIGIRDETQPTVIAIS
jgi:hypothetical protein